MALFLRSKTDEEYKMVIVMRSDLKMSKGKLAAQAAHAAVNCAFAAKKKVVLKVDSLERLYEIKAIVDANSINNSLITDAGRTEIAPGSVTCIGIGPSTDAILDKITGELSML